MVADTWELIIHPLYDNGGNDKGLFWHLLASLKRVALGYAFAAIGGIALGVLIGSSKWAMRALDPLFQVLRTIPPLAWLPLSLAAFRDGQPSAIFVIFITAIWPIIINTAVGVRNIPQDYRNVSRVLRLNGFEFFTHIMLPAAAPYIFTGLRIGIGLSWLAIVAAEMLIGGVGIGFFIWDAWNSSLISDIILALVYVGIIGFLLDRAGGLHGQTGRQRNGERMSAGRSRRVPQDRASLQDLRQRRNAQRSVARHLAGRGARASSSPSSATRVAASRRCSTSLRGSRDASSGYVFLEGREVHQPGPDRAVVFQNHSLLPWLTVYDNVRLAVDKVFRGTKTSAERHEWTLRNLELVHMTHAMKKRPGEISGGMKQRVGIARALAMSPKVLLLDEPFGALDALTRAHLQEQVMQIHADLGNTVLMITHDVDEAVLLSDRIVMMTNGPAAQIGELHTVPLPRPSNRLELIADAYVHREPRQRCCEFLHKKSHYVEAA